MQYKCIVCGVAAVVVYHGDSLCKVDFFDAFIDQQFKQMTTAVKLKKYTKIVDIPTKEQLVKIYTIPFQEKFGIIK